MKKVCILIYGMHRSGTSALAGALHKIGLSFGRSLMPPSYDNPLGFFENYHIQELNDEILSLFGSHWDDTEPLPPNWLSDDLLQPYFRRAKSILKKEFKSEKLFALKDPRISITRFFWHKVLSEEGIDIFDIVVLREVSEIAASLEARNYFSVQKSYALTLHYLLNAERQSRNGKRMFVSYNNLLDGPTHTVREIFKNIDLKLEIDLNTLNDAIDLRLKNHTAKTEEIIREQKYTPGLKDKRKFEIFREVNSTFKILASAKNKSFIDKKSEQQLDTSREKYYELPITFHNGLKINTNPKAKLLVDYGHGYNERNAKVYQVNLKEENLKFSFESNKEPIHSLKLLPNHSRCSLKIMEIQMAPEQVYELTENSSRRKNRTFYFDEDSPQINLSFKTPARLSEITFRIVFLDTKGVLTRVALDKRTKSKALTSNNHWLAAIQAMAENPIKLIKSINLKNLKTLRSALKREDPRQILRNFKKLLRRSQTQKIIEEQSSRNKESILGKIEKGHNPNNDKQGDSIISHDQHIKRRVLYITPALPEYDTSSGGRRAVRLLSLLCNSCEVYIFTINDQNQKYKVDLESRGIKVITTQNISEIKEQLSYVQILLYSWYYTLYEAEGLRKIYKSALTIIDSVDVNWVREIRSINIWQGTNAKRAAKNKKNEIEAYSAVDKVWVVSQPDKEAILAEIPSCSIAIVSNIHDIINQNYTDPGTNNILFIGGYNHYPNLSAVQTLANDIFPKILEQIPSAQLLIAGSNAPEEVAKLGNQEQVKFLGFIPEKQMEALYGKVLLSVAPLKAGAGVKGKITEALAYTVPIVTNKIGNEGIHLIHEESGLIAESNSEMSDVIVKAMKREYDLRSIATKGQAILKDLYSPIIAQSQMIKSFERPIMICIVTWNNLELLKSCIESIEKHTFYENYLIAVYSNGCIDGTQEYLRNLENNPRILSILSVQNDVYVKPNNHLMGLNKDHDVVLLNNDVKVTSGWLNGLYNAAYVSSEIGIVGSKILYPNGILQEYGSELFEDGAGRNIGKGDEQPFHKDYNSLSAVSYVSGCAMYIKRMTIEKIGVFDEDFHPCYCEDSDFCYTAWVNNIQTVVTPDSIIYHYEGGTAGTNDESGFKKYQSINIKKFLMKHKNHIKDINSKVKKANKKIKQLYS